MTASTKERNFKEEVGGGEHMRSGDASNSITDTLAKGREKELPKGAEDGDRSAVRHGGGRHVVR